MALRLAAWKGGPPSSELGRAQIRLVFGPYLQSIVRGDEQQGSSQGAEY